MDVMKRLRTFVYAISRGLFKLKNQTKETTKGHCEINIFDLCFDRMDPGHSN